MRASGPLILTFATAALGFYAPSSPFVYADGATARQMHTSTSSSDSKQKQQQQDDNNNPSQKTQKKSSIQKQRRDDHHHDCPFYGCPLTPQDVHYNTETVKAALEQLRQMRRTDGADSDAEQLLADSATPEAVTLTLIGYKGGSLQEQVNQDRALVVQPFHIANDDEQATRQVDSQKQQQKASSSSTLASSSAANTKRASTEAASRMHHTTKRKVNIPPGILLGVFDGHAPRGEIVSEFTKSQLPILLSHKLHEALQDVITYALSPEDSETDSDIMSLDSVPEDEIINRTKQALIETFVELDRDAPAAESGGCTATVVLRLLDNVYIANAGDSRSFIVAYRPSTRQSHVLYVSREDKPNLPDERARVEAAGGQVYIPVRGTSRVVYHDPRTGAPSGLAMSRSIGDWAAGKLGVIPDPIVEVLNISEIVDAEMTEIPDTQSYILDENGDMVKTGISYDEDSRRNGSSPVDDVHIFAVSATDGMMDYLEPEDVAKVLADALFDKDGAHPISAAEHLVFAAANAWQQEKQGRYRDDIAIAVSTIRLPPETTNSTADAPTKPEPQ